MKQEEHDTQSLFEGKRQAAQDPDAQTPAAGGGKGIKIAIVAALAVVVVAVLLLKKGGDAVAPPGDGETGAQIAGVSQAAAVPRIVEIGSISCVPCKMMAPILEELRKEYAGALRVDFIDVYQDRSAGPLYRIRVIPTQIFFDSSGKEIFRHEGFFPKEQILAKWKELGVDLQTAGQTATN